MLKKIEHGEVLELKLDRPPANALNHALVKELRAAIEAAPGAGAKAIVLSGSEGMYSGGLDVPELLTYDRAAMARFWQDFFDLLQSIALSPIPVAAAITGHSPAGGAVLAIFCDTRIAAQGKFKIGLNEVQVGLPVPRVILAALTRLVGPRQAERLAVRGLLVSPEEALAAGLVDQLTAPEEVVPAALAWCREIAKLPPSAMGITRRALRADFKALFEGLSEGTREEMTAAWFSEEPQRVLHALVAQLNAKKK
ncbi:MAG TPA: enoyl-CoA hydratase/isomerase family protein [Gammaproteobacteria bacterium]|nr:enoyl-CoA hydratase/isomerase family protein [Gammaproteobacteria bacterium]